MTYSVSDLRRVSEEELIRQHDNTALNTSAGVDYYLQELARRSQQKQTDAMLGYTKWITVMTAIVTIATIVNLAVALAAWLKF